MTYRNLYFLSFFWMVFISFADYTLPLKNDWSKFNAQSVPDGWYFNGYAGYKPAPTLRVENTDDAEFFLHISDVKGKSGVELCHSKRFKALDGDIVKVTARARGKGNIWFRLQVFHNSKWLAVLKSIKVELHDEWQDIQIELPVVNISETSPTNSFMFTFGIGKENELCLDKLNIKLKEKEKIEGTQVFPNKWIVFLPVDKNIVATREELCEIPNQFAGIQGKHILLENNEFNFIKDFAEKKAGNCAWLFAELESELEENYTISAGADWWMTIWLNGNIVIDTREHGNDKHPARMTDFSAAGKLHKGKNILAVRYVTGKGSASLCMGGPQDLRNQSQKLRIVQNLALDDYDQEKHRENLTELIQAIPTEGLLTVTGQGVYQSITPIKVRLNQETYLVPDVSSGRYLAAAVRIQNFGCQKRNDSIFELLFEGKEHNEAKVEIIHSATKNELKGKIILNGTAKQNFSLPYDVLPVDLLFAINKRGECQVNINSLADSSFRSITGNLKSDMWLEEVQAALRFSSQNKQVAEVVIDNFQIVHAAPEIMRNLVPLKLEKAPEFDPVAENWKLVFSDEFDGKEIDWNKWSCSERAKKNITLNDGFLEVRPLPHGRPEPSSRGSHLSAGSLISQKQFKYGYFEARLRFTQKRGWWSFLFMYAGAVGNPMLDGLEIDIYEDYYMGGKSNKDSNVLDHNLHCYVGGILKSWNYNSILPGDPDDFYTIGVKWTPFEISYYLDNKLIRTTANHSPHDSVTFDPVNHANCITPLDLRVGASIMSDKSNQFIGPDQMIDEVFKVDYVRIYEYPNDRAPTIKLHNQDAELIVKYGEEFTIEARAEASVLTGAPIVGAYLLDGGQVIGYTDKEPYSFTLSIDEKFYEGNAYMRSGRTGIKPSLGALHAYSIIVQDANGQAANTDAVLKFPLPKKSSRPFRGEAQKIPGTILIGHYDEGGNDVAYLDDNQNNSTWRKDEGVDASENVIGHILTGEWVRYSVDIEEEGAYNVELNYGTPAKGKHSVIMLLDGKEAGRFQLTRHEAKNWGIDSVARLNDLVLPKGEHKITLIMMGAFNISNLTFKKK